MVLLQKQPLDNVKVVCACCIKIVDGHWKRYANIETEALLIDWALEELKDYVVV